MMRGVTRYPTDHPVAGHGTRARYNHRSAACHCPECAAANAAYMRAYRAPADPGPRVHPDQLTLVDGGDDRP